MRSLPQRRASGGPVTRLLFVGVKLLASRAVAEQGRGPARDCGALLWDGVMRNVADGHWHRVPGPATASWY